MDAQHVVCRVAGVHTSWEAGVPVRRTTVPWIAHTSPVHTGDAEEQALFERLEREFADVRVPRMPTPRMPRMPREPRPPRRRARVLLWVVVLSIGCWSLTHSTAGRGLLAPVAGWLQPAPPASEGDYAFLQETAGGPVRWSSCRTIEVVVNDALRPLEAWDVVERGLAEVAEVSGLTITVVGRTDEQPSDDRPAEQPRYGVGWSPVLIAWTTPETDPGLEGATVGLGGGGSITGDNGFTRYVSGQITLDAPQFEQILTRPGGDAVAKAIVMHEMAHVLGLDHVDSPYEVMAEGDGPTELGPGDRAGLTIAGSGPCV